MSSYQSSTLKSELRKGYKQTEVGLIPVEWAVEKLDELGAWKGGMTPSMRNQSYWANGNVPWISSGDVKSAQLKETAYSITKTAVRQGTTTLLPANSIVIVARSGILRKYLPVASNVVPMAINQDIKALIPLGRYIPAFLAYSIVGSSPRILARCMKAGTTVESIEFRWLKAFTIAMPPKAEQSAIAEALSDLDGLLSGLDRLIAKKRDLKQAAMQQLLTGQTRLPGFHGEWEETTLGQIGECVIGLTYKPENVVEHGLLVLRSSNVQNRRLVYDDNVHVNLRVPDHLYTQLGDILVCVRNGSRNLIGKCAAIDSSAVGVTFGAFMSVYRTKHWRYVLHVFQSDSIQRQIRDNIGATINQITNKDMKAFRIRLPPEVEQAAIAEVLTDMDAERAALEQRREKTRALKQAMMQELLTGKTRLISTSYE
jgi:type I restriction enzyme S subunit